MSTATHPVLDTLFGTAIGLPLGCKFCTEQQIGGKNNSNKQQQAHSEHAVLKWDYLQLNPCDPVSFPLSAHGLPFVHPILSQVIVQVDLVEVYSKVGAALKNVLCNGCCI